MATKGGGRRRQIVDDEDDDMTDKSVEGTKKNKEEKGIEIGWTDDDKSGDSSSDDDRPFTSLIPKASGKVVKSKVVQKIPKKKAPSNPFGGYEYKEGTLSAADAADGWIAAKVAVPVAYKAPTFENRKKQKSIQLSSEDSMSSDESSEEEEEMELSDSEEDTKKKRLEALRLKRQQRGRKTGPVRKAASIHVVDEEDDDDEVIEVESDENESRTSKSLTERCALLAEKLVNKSGERSENEIETIVKEVCPKLDLKDHQKRGVKWVIDLEAAGIGGILADEMGLGKTVQSIAYIASKRSQQEIALVIAPASTLGNWQKDFGRFAPDLRIVVYAGADRERFRPSAVDVVLTTYSAWERDSAIADREMFMQLPISRLVLDEGHCMKNPKSQRTRRLALLKPRHSKFILTGTPVQNNPLELLTLLKFLNPTLFTGLPNDLTEIAESLPLAQLKKAMAPFVLRRTKNQVLDALPLKINRTEMLDLDAKQRAIYTSVLSRNTTAQHLFTELRKAANHPLLLRHRYQPSDIDTIVQVCLAQSHFGTSATETMIRTELAGYCDFDLHDICTQYRRLKRLVLDDSALYEASTKCQYLKSLLPQLKKQKHKVLLFSQWVRLLDLLESLCENLGLETCRLDGSTDIHDRQRLVDDFNSPDSELDVFLLSTRAGGLGINLVGADTVVLHDCDFNPEIDRQAVDRCHRIGQTKEVTVYRLVTKETVDQSILDLAQRKAIVNNHLNHHFNDKQQLNTEEEALGTIDDSVFVSLVEQSIRNFQSSSQLSSQPTAEVVSHSETKNNHDDDLTSHSDDISEKKTATKRRIDNLSTQASMSDDDDTSAAAASSSKAIEKKEKPLKKKKKKTTLDAKNGGVAQVSRPRSHSNNNNEGTSSSRKKSPHFLT